MTTKYRIGLPVDFEGLFNKNTRDLVYFEDDFLKASVSSTADLSTWLLTKVATQANALPALLDGTSASQELTGGWAVLTTGASASEALNMTVNGEMFQIRAGKPLFFEIRVKFPDISNGNFFAGLTESDTEVINGGLAAGAVGFLIGVDGIIYCQTHIGGSSKSVATGDVVADSDIWNLAFYYDGVDTIRFYTAECSAATHTGELVGVGTRTVSTTAHYCPVNVMLTPTIEIEMVAGATTIDIDRVICVQQRTQTIE
jgi:hypothetical protein